MTSPGHPTQVVLQLQRLSKLTKLGSAYGSKSSHHKTTAQIAASQSTSRIVQDEGNQLMPLIKSRGVDSTIIMQMNWRL